MYIYIVDSNKRSGSGSDDNDDDGKSEAAVIVILLVVVIWLHKNLFVLFLASYGIRKRQSLHIHKVTTCVGNCTQSNHVVSCRLQILLA
jgi:hypothetical protein